MLLGDLAQGDGLAYAGAREQHVDLALFPLHDVEQPVQVVEIGRVTLDAGYIPADYFDGLVDLLLLPACNKNVSTLLHEELGACQRHAARPTRDDGNFSFKLSHIDSRR